MTTGGDKDISTISSWTSIVISESPDTESASWGWTNLNIEHEGGAMSEEESKEEEENINLVTEGSYIDFGFGKKQKVVDLQAEDQVELELHSGQKLEETGYVSDRGISITKGAVARRKNENSKEKKDAKQRKKMNSIGRTESKHLLRRGESQFALVETTTGGCEISAKKDTGEIQNNSKERGGVTQLGIPIKKSIRDIIRQENRRSEYKNMIFDQKDKISYLSKKDMVSGWLESGTICDSHSESNKSKRTSCDSKSTDNTRNSSGEFEAENSGETSIIERGMEHEGGTTKKLAENNKKGGLFEWILSSTAEWLMENNGSSDYLGSKREVSGIHSCSIYQESGNKSKGMEDVFKEFYKFQSMDFSKPL
ncbi:hypothetical protein AX774_g4197 [Zancudomyces culisetae]|uniref:Uncharacterized protein n=1 Tax=Zancudomyces culisetae TaxID=1213189 RepID=A0A1R1PMZ2_ZANCU|nr:hypothetical protein AX774_g4513 [Zancudomyces culisetae]OMH82324.1 hypothetical protein AX774_g4197 [Zancudomyces culisetae]|eukprot:OMH82020.1 hypothetical protein AX774_g4513 [Zancudomyces culisetae]